MLKTWKPTIALALLTFGSITGINISEDIASQGADLLIMLIGSVLTFAAWIAKLWATRRAITPNDNGHGTGLLLALLLALPLLGLSACASRVAETPAQMVFALSAEHQAAQHIVAAYVESAAAKPLLVIALNDLDQAAHDSLHATQAALRAGNAPQVPALLAVARQAVMLLTRRLAQEGLLLPSTSLTSPSLGA